MYADSANDCESKTTVCPAPNDASCHNLPVFASIFWAYQVDRLVDDAEGTGVDGVEGEEPRTTGGKYLAGSVHVPKRSIYTPTAMGDRIGVLVFTRALRCQMIKCTYGDDVDVGKAKYHYSFRYWLVQTIHTQSPGGSTVSS